MEEILVDTGEEISKRNQNAGTSKSGAFNAELEIAEVFGTFSGKHVRPKKKEEKPSQEEPPEKKTEPSPNFKTGGFEDQMNATTNSFTPGGFGEVLSQPTTNLHAPDANRPSSYPNRMRNNRHPKNSRFENDQSASGNQRTPKTFKSPTMGHSQFGSRFGEESFGGCFNAPPPHPPPPASGFGMGGMVGNTEFGLAPPTPNNGFPPGPLLDRRMAPMPMPSLTHVSGFGCSNEMIARLPGRSRGRGRRGNTRRGGATRTESMRSFVQNNTNFDYTDNNNAGMMPNQVNMMPNQPHMMSSQPIMMPSHYNMMANNTGYSSPFVGLERKDSSPMKEMHVVGGRRQSAFGEERKGEEVPCKRRRLTCVICGKNGHSSEDCYRNPKNQTNREVIRCYNCNERGHMAVRCQKPSMRTKLERNPSPKSKERKMSISEKKEAAAANNLTAKGLEVIVKLMKDKHMRQEAAKKTPQLFEEMLSFMLENVQLNIASSK